VPPATFLRCLTALAFCWLGFHIPNGAAEEPGFRRFAGSISPDGAYVLAWGWGEDDQPNKLKEWPPGRDTAGDLVANYLVDAVRGQVLAVIPEHHHFHTSDGRWKRFSGLDVTWSEDSQSALAIYEGRWSNESILWINPRSRRFVEVLPQLAEAYSRFLAKKEKVEDSGAISFSLPALLPGGVLVIRGRARPSVVHPPEYNYVLKLQMNFGGGTPKYTLVTARKAPEEPANEKVEDALNQAYQQLRAKLNDAARAALKEKQLAWLKQREALPESDRWLFTHQRTSYLRARAEK
jgi:hypothetical protein